MKSLLTPQIRQFRNPTKMVFLDFSYFQTPISEIPQSKNNQIPQNKPKTKVTKVFSRVFRAFGAKILGEDAHMSGLAYASGSATRQSGIRGFCSKWYL